MTKYTEILEKLYEIKKQDIDPTTGRLFTYIYETGIKELREVAHKAYEMFIETNALDPTVFKSAFFFEKQLVEHAKTLVYGDEKTVGTVTYGGTESIMLALKAARWRFRKLYGAIKTPHVIVPVTGHPSIRKAAHYLDMKIDYVDVDPDTKKVDVVKVQETISDNTALIVGSAPNFPYGTIDPIKDLSDIAVAEKIPLHVDACVGGYILPYMEKNDIEIPMFDFRLEGVSSISMDLHKYGYTPKGASIILFRDPEYKEGTIFVDLKWPGYPLINTTVLSSRSIAPMAAAYATITYLGEEGYTKLAQEVIEARDYLCLELSKLGFKTLAPIESPLLSLSLETEDDVFNYYAGMTLKQWIIGLQPKVEGLAPYNIHLTISPIHNKVKEEYIEDSREVLEGPTPKELIEINEIIEKNPLTAATKIGETPLDGVLIAKILGSIPKELAEELARQLAVQVYKE